MRVTLFWYMMVSPFVEFPDLAWVTPGEAKRVGSAPKCPSRALALEGPFEGGTMTRRAAQPKQSGAVPPGAEMAPKQ